MKILMIYPQYPNTYWSFKHALPFISKKAAVPPLGLITVSAMLPSDWEKKLVDLNIAALRTKDLEWADYVFLSAMYIQQESVKQVIDACISNHVKIVAGGPLFTQEYANYPQIDHFVLNEAEITLPEFLSDLRSGITPKKVYQTTEYADITKSPIPDYKLLDTKAYAFMNLQVSRGCPFACDFCEITALLGHKVRMKTSQQVINELDAIHQLHWRGPVSVVDDNFIGNKLALKQDLLPAMLGWMKAHKQPFTFNIQSSINLADDANLMRQMNEIGFNSTFIGIETPLELSLHECNKVQNKNRDLLQSVKIIQQAGFHVSGGFIVGFDSDLPTVFQRQIDFIQQSGIVSAMVGLLNAPKNTVLYNRLKGENRLSSDVTGSNTDFSMNFIPKMNREKLLQGYESIIQNIYAAKPYYKRARQFFKNYKKSYTGHSKINFSYVFAFLKTIVIIGIKNKGRLEYWKFLLWTLFNRPALFVEAISFTVYGFHYRTVYGLS